jgi:hypothetical protein
MARFQSFAPAELGRMFLVLHRSEKRLRTIEEELDSGSMTKSARLFAESLEPKMDHVEYTLCNGKPHSDLDFMYNERRQVKYSIRALKQWASGEMKRPTAAQWAKFGTLIKEHCEKHDNLLDTDDEELSYIDGDESDAPEAADDDEEEADADEADAEEADAEEDDADGDGEEGDDDEEFQPPEEEEEEEEDDDESDADAALAARPAADDDEEEEADEEDGEEEDGEEEGGEEEDDDEEDAGATMSPAAVALLSKIRSKK